METRMEGKNCVVTGADSGIGYATGEGPAARGATVYMVCRNKEKGEAALSEIQSVTGDTNIRLEICDLSSVNDVKSFASRFFSKDLPLHVLVNNDGLLENKRVTTSEGYELNFAVNVLGTFSLTELMLPSLEKAAPDARVITVSSGGWDFSDAKFDGLVQYARKKRVQVKLTENGPIHARGKGLASTAPWLGRDPWSHQKSNRLRKHVFRKADDQRRRRGYRYLGWHYSRRKNCCPVHSTSTERKRPST